MNNGIDEIDHLLCFVQDAAQAASDFEQLGFTVTPPSRIERAGIENRLVAFEPAAAGVANYIELMGAFDPSRLPAALSDLLVPPEGVRCLMFGSDDAANAHEALTRGGYAPDPMNTYQRAWVLPSGEVLQLAFSVVEPMQGPTAFGVCQHRTLHHYLRPDFQQHPNGAQRIVSVYVVAQDPTAAADFYGKLLESPLERSTGTVSLPCRQVALHFLDPSAFARKFPGAPTSMGIAGYQIVCRSLADTAAYLSKAGIETAASSSGFHVFSPLTHGHLIHFTEAS